MSARTRVMDSRKQIVGSYVYNTVPTVRTGARGTLTTTKDEIGERDQDNPFNLDRQTRLFSVVDGTNGGNFTFDHFPLQGVVLRGFPSTSYGLTLPNYAAMAPIWVGQMTPRAQALNVPAFVGELPDLPSMITQIPDLVRHWGRRRINPRTAASAAGILRDGVGDVGSAFLGWKFGWSPLLRDLMQMLGMMNAIKANIEMLQRLRAGRSIKRSVRLAPQLVCTDMGDLVLHSARTWIVARVTRVNTLRHWVTSRWEPLFPWVFRRMTDSDIWEDAYRSATGLTVGGAIEAWWELLPWSWLADWFMHIQDQMARFVKNGWLLRCTSLCYMRTTEVHEYFALKPVEAWVKVKGQNLLHRTVKERFPLTIAQLPPDDPSPPALPALSGSQMEILGALLAQKQKGFRL